MAKSALPEAIPASLVERHHRARSPIQGLLTFTRRKPLGAFGGAVVVLLIFTALAANVVAPFDPYEVNPALRNHPPSVAAGFLLGTDNYGRDVLTRIIYGARISLYVGCISVGMGVVTGTILGLLSGYTGGRTDILIQRLMDSIMAVPSLVLAISISAFLGASLTNTMIAIAVVIVPGASRIVRSAVLSVKESPYVEAAHSIGAGYLRILGLHILPNVLAPIIVLVTIDLGGAILTEASLSFLGVGTQPPTPSWGEMLSLSGQRYMRSAPWLAIVPGLAISLAVFGFNLLGDALRDVLDPRLRGR